MVQRIILKVSRVGAVDLFKNTAQNKRFLKKYDLFFAIFKSARLPSCEPRGAEVLCTPAKLGHPLFAKHSVREQLSLRMCVSSRDLSTSILTVKHSGIMQTSFGVWLHRVNW